jgi:hypothetical protein
MRPTALAAVLLTTLAGLGLASTPQAPPAAAERLERLQEDRNLIVALVDGGLRLAAEDDPLQRAQTCNALVGHLAREVKQAAARKNRSRAADLGRHLQALLERGVASNLSLARSQMPQDSPVIADVQRLGQEAVEVMGPAMRELEASPEQEVPDMHSTVQGLSRARAEIEKVSKSQPKGRPALNPKTPGS